MKTPIFDPNGDPYVIQGTDVLRNKLGLTDLKALQEAENEHSAIRMQLLSIAPLEGNFDNDHLLHLHYFLFQRVYEWAGEPRTINVFKSEKILGGGSVEYSSFRNIEEDLADAIANMKSVQWQKLSHDEKAKTFGYHLTRIWKVHPFRDGNTRTTVTFCIHYAQSEGFKFNQRLFYDNGKYLRACLVAAAAFYKNERIGDRSKPEYLSDFLQKTLIPQKREIGISSRADSAKKRAAEKTSLRREQGRQHDGKEAGPTQ